MEDWKVLSERCVYRNEPWLVVHEQEIALPNGHHIPDYIVTEVPDVAMVFAVTDGGEVLMVEQYKHGVGRWIWDLPAGYIDPGEDPLAAAKRELEEETGFVGGRWRPLMSTYFDENRHSNRFFYYLATDVVSEGKRELDDTEDITVHRTSTSSLLGRVIDGRVVGMHSSLGILRAMIHLGELEEREPSI